MLGKWIVGCAVALIVLAFVAPASASIDDFVGRWTSQSSGGDITSIQVTRSGAGLRIEVFTRCAQQGQQTCGWGEAAATTFASSALGNPASDAVALLARYDAPVPRRTVVMHLTSDGARYEVFNDFTETERRASHVETGSLRRLQVARVPRNPGLTIRRATLPGENCVAIDQANLQVVNVGGQWNVMDGARQLLHFGAERAAADRALEVIRFYGLTSQCIIPFFNAVIANPNPTMMYWKRGGAPPGEVMPGQGQNCRSIDPSLVRADYINGNWHVIELSTSLLNFGANLDHAEQAIATIRHYNLNLMCFSGPSGPRMQYWLSR